MKAGMGVNFKCVLFIFLVINSMNIFLIKKYHWNDQQLNSG